MKILKLINVIVLALTVTTAFSQPRDMAESRHQNMFGQELLSYRFYNFADSTSEQLSRMDFHVGVINDLLTFIKLSDNSYRSRYEVNIIVYNSRNEPMVEKSTANRIIVQTYGETNTHVNPSYHELSVSLAPGNYKGELMLNDLESGEALVKQLDLTFRDFSRDQVRLSDIMYIDKIDTTAGGVVYTPNLHHVFDDVNSAFAAYVEIYPPNTGEDVEAEMSIFDASGAKLYTFAKTYSSQFDQITAVIPFRAHLIKPGEYYLTANAQAGKFSAKIQRMFSVFWGNVPVAKTNLDIAVEQLALVANKETVEKMRQADEAERKIVYDKFWDERDPSPLTNRNELKEEFFKRVDFSNRNFTEISSGRSGWQTDRGKIYVVYGAPDNVDHRDSEMNLPATEIWYYNRLSRTYFFSDRNGEGVYRLIKVE